jgi:hypothetical protein
MKSKLAEGLPLKKSTNFYVPLSTWREISQEEASACAGYARRVTHDEIADAEGIACEYHFSLLSESVVESKCCQVREMAL